MTLYMLFGFIDCQMEHHHERVHTINVGDRSRCRLA